MSELASRNTLFAHSIGLTALVACCFVIIFTPDLVLYSTPDASLELQIDNTTKSSALPSMWQDREVKSIRKFRTHFPAPQTANSVTSIYLPAVRQSATAYLNGQKVWQGERFDSDYARLWYHPVIFSLPPSLLQPQNTLEITVVADGRQGGYLSKAYMGPHQQLIKHKNWRTFFVSTILQATSVLLIVIGLLNLYLWSLRRADSYYLWYALAALCWGAHSALLVIPSIPISEELRVALRLISLGYGIVFVVLFNQRYFGFRNRYFDIALWVYCVPLALPLLFMSVESILFYGHQVWVRGNLLLGLFIALQLSVIFFRHRKIDAAYLLYIGLPLLVVGFRDMLVLNNRWSPENAFLINHVTLPAMAVAMWFILRRLSNALEFAEQINVSLERRVEQKEQEIVDSFAAQESLKKQKVLAEERERIMRDIHDGIGAQLIGLRSLLSSKSAQTRDLNRYIETALTDLRIVINSLDSASQTLPNILGSFRQRWQRSAEAQGGSLRWNVTRPNSYQELGPTKTLHLMRILEEAFSNCLKHSSHADIDVRTYYDDDLASIKISNPFDDKQEFEQGRGLSNMRQRAAKIDAHIAFDARDKIFTFKVELPQ